MNHTLYRVSQVIVPNGAIQSGGRKYEYGNCMTKITDLAPETLDGNNTPAGGKPLIYHFNGNGNVASVNARPGNACFAKYSDDLPVHHPEGASRMQQNVIRLLKNHNFDAATARTNASIGSTYPSGFEHLLSGFQNRRLPEILIIQQKRRYLILTFQEKCSYQIPSFIVVRPTRLELVLG